MTEAQVVANGANVQFSTGPRTEEGKNRSSLNAFRHGLTGQIVIHTPEDGQAFQKHCDDIRESLAPVSGCSRATIDCYASVGSDSGVHSEAESAADEVDHREAD
jgi:hypothetical protein